MADNEENPSERAVGPGLPYKEIYFLGLASQSNIYCCSKLQDPRYGYEKWLVGTLRGKVSCLECGNLHLCNPGPDTQSHAAAVSHQPQANEVYFTYIPGDAEIISLDAFCKHYSSSPSVGKVGKYLVVGISLILLKELNGTQQNQHFLNVYTAVEPDLKLELDDTAKICQHIELNFTPYQLTHASIQRFGEDETVFLLAGSDRRVHMFTEDKQQQQRFEEYPCDDFFPEFKDLPSNVIWMDIKEYSGENKRLTAFGCQNGYVRVCVTKVGNSALLKTWDMRTDSPISSVKLFSLQKPRPQLTSTLLEQNQRSLGEHNSSTESVNLLVTSAMEVAVVFLEVELRGFSKMVVLSQSDNFDIVTCSLIMDFDYDGNHEILLGTYGQELLVYKWYTPNENINAMVHFDLTWRKSFPKPLFAIENLNLVNDGLQELAVLSLTGVHILQYDVDVAVDNIVKKIQTAIQSSIDVKDNDEKSNEDNSEDVNENGDPT